ncbi:MAG: hypothetical protein LBD68_11500, partial [Zoogloeaceae bacterium]|nr:hypothetical protein [Zoogloeaceae bacterium]
MDRRPRCGFGYRALRSISFVLVAALLNLSLSPLAQAAVQSQGFARGVEQTAAEAYGALLSRIQAAANGGQWVEVKSLAAKLETEKGRLEEEWASLNAAWQAAGVSGDAADRQKEVEAALNSRHETLKGLLSGIDEAAGQAALKDYLNGLPASSTASLVDVQNLPWRVEKGEVRAALEDEAELNAALKLETQAAVSAAPQAQTQARLMRGAPQKPDLSPTLDAPQSAEIKALAAELGNNPYQIHQWVYDNIRFYPTYGSVQGAEETLARKQGNAFDIASLLIGLLRSAGIESRYVYGTVLIPSEQV